MDIQQDAPRGGPQPFPPPQRSNTPPQGLLPLFQEETPRPTRPTPTAPPPMSRSASKGILLLSQGGQPLTCHPPSVRLSLVRCRTTAKTCPQDWALDTFFPLFNTTASGAGMGFFPYLILLLRLNTLLQLFAFKTHQAGGIACPYTEILLHLLPCLPIAALG